MAEESPSSAIPPIIISELNDREISSSSASGVGSDIVVLIHDHNVLSGDASSSDGGPKATLPFEILDYIFGCATFFFHMFSIEFSKSPILSNNQIADISEFRRLVMEARAVCAQFCMLNKDWYKISAERLYHILVNTRTDSVYADSCVNASLVLRPYGSATYASLIRRSHWSYSSLDDDNTHDLVRILNACYILVHVHLHLCRVEHYNVQAIMEALRDASSVSLLYLRCSIPYPNAIFLVQYVDAFVNLRTLILGATHIPQRHSEWDNDVQCAFPGNLYGLSFPYLHTLSIFHIELLPLIQTWFCPELAAFALERSRPYNIEEFLLPFLEAHGAGLKILDLYRMGDGFLRRRLLLLCPNLIDLILNIRAEEFVQGDIGQLVHANLQRVGLKGTSLFGPHGHNAYAMEIVSYISSFAAFGNYPAWHTVQLLDFWKSYLDEYHWDREIAQMWMSCTQGCEERDVRFLDRKGMSLVPCTSTRIRERVQQ